MAKLRREIARDEDRPRDTKRQERRRHEVPSVAIAGYTNAGKSSLLNRLTGAGVLVENALFATLDPTVRRAETPDGRTYTLADTVGFVRHLPHQLVEAFRSTLEEVAEADLILHVVDGSHADPEEQLARRPRGARRRRRAQGARDRGDQQGRRGRPAGARPAAPAARSTASWSRPAPGRACAELLALIDRELPRPSVEVDVLVPVRPGRPGLPGARRRRGARAGAPGRRHLGARPGHPGAGRRARAVRRERCADRVNSVTNRAKISPTARVHPGRAPDEEISMPSTSWGRLAVPAPVLALLGVLAAALVVVFSLPVLGRGEWADGVAETSLAVAAALGLGSLLRRAFGVNRPGPAAVAADGGHRRRPGRLGGLRRAARALDPLARDAPGRHRRRRPGALAAAEPAHHPARPGPAGRPTLPLRGSRSRSPPPSWCCPRVAAPSAAWAASCTRSPTCCWPPSRWPCSPGRGTRAGWRWPRAWR